MKFAASLLAAALLAGCSSMPASMSTTINCKPNCDDAWERAQGYVATHSGYRIAVATPNLIQTYGPVSQSQPMQPAFLLIRGGETITATAAFADNPLGNVYDPEPFIRALERVTSGEAKAP